VAKSLETVMLDYLISLAVTAINPDMDYEADKLFDGTCVHVCGLICVYYSSNL
jgi:hypothetical protein